MRLESSCKAAHLSIENFIILSRVEKTMLSCYRYGFQATSICGCTRKLRVLLASAVASTVALLQEEMDGRINS